VTTFGKLHEYYRTAKHVSRAELATHIQKDPSYIRRIEIENYVPPFGICELVSEKLTLSVSEKKALYQLGFEKRIASDRGFYDFLTAGDSKNDGGSSLATDPVSRLSPDPDALSGCIYQISWKTYNHMDLLKPPSDHDLMLFFKRTFQALSLACYEIRILPQAVHLIVEITPDYKVKDFVNNLQNSSAGFFHTKFPNIDAPTDLWDTAIAIHTVAAADLTTLDADSSVSTKAQNFIA